VCSLVDPVVLDRVGTRVDSLRVGVVSLGRTVVCRR
jgi:hypothetical protein